MTHSKITKVEFIILEFFLVHSFFIGNGFSRIFEISQNDTWISMILGTLLGIVILYIFHLIGKNVNNDLKTYLNNHKFVKLIFTPFIFIYLFILVMIPVFSLEALVNSYYLTNTNAFLIIIPFVLLIFYMMIKGKLTIIKVFEFVIPFIFILNLIGTFGLTKNINFNNILPILNNDYKNILLGSLIFAILSNSFSFLTIDEKIDFKTKLIGYIIACINLIITSIVITTVLGRYFIKMYSFPEYMVIKKINLFSFLQNLENILFMPGYFYLLSISSLSLFKIKELQKDEDNLTMPIFVCLAITIIIGSFYSNNYGITILTSKILPYILGINILILGPTLYIFTHKKKTKSI